MQATTSDQQNEKHTNGQARIEPVVVDTAECRFCHYTSVASSPACYSLSNCVALPLEIFLAPRLTPQLCRANRLRFELFNAY